MLYNYIHRKICCLLFREFNYFYKMFCPAKSCYWHNMNVTMEVIHQFSSKYGLEMGVRTDIYKNICENKYDIYRSKSWIFWAKLELYQDSQNSYQPLWWNNTVFLLTKHYHCTKMFPYTGIFNTLYYILNLIVSFLGTHHQLSQCWFIKLNLTEHQAVYPNVSAQHSLGPFRINK